MRVMSASSTYAGTSARIQSGPGAMTAAARPVNGQCAPLRALTPVEVNRTLPGVRRAPIEMLPEATDPAMTLPSAVSGRGPWSWLPFLGEWVTLG